MSAACAVFYYAWVVFLHVCNTHNFRLLWHLDVTSWTRPNCLLISRNDAFPSSRYFDLARHTQKLSNDVQHISTGRIIKSNPLQVTIWLDKWETLNGMKKINAYCLKALGNKENLCKNVKRGYLFLRFFEILQNLNFDSEIDCMTLEGTISLLITQCFRKGNGPFILS